MRWLAALALLLLPGCWYGGDFYAAAELRPGLPAGRYQVEPTSDRSEEGGEAIVTQRADGFTEIVPINRDGRADRGDATTLGLVPIDRDGRLFVAWPESTDETRLPDTEGLRPYGLLRRNPDGSADLLMIACTGAVLEAARQAGAGMPGENRTYCRFESRQSLEAALRAVAANLDDGFRFRPAAAP